MARAGSAAPRPRAAGALRLAASLLARRRLRRVDVDAVYAVRLAAPPTEAAWDLALPRR